MPAKKIPEKLRAVKTLPEAKYITYDPSAPEYPDVRANPAKHASLIRSGGEREFYKLEARFIGSATYDNRIWHLHGSDRRFLSAGEVIEYLIESGMEDDALNTIEPGTYTASYTTASVLEDSVVLTQANGKKIIIKKN